MSQTEIVTIRCLRDNYAYLLRANGLTALFDAPEAAPILDALAERGWGLDQIFLTHHHADHIDGVAELVANTGAKIVGAQADAHRLPALDVPVSPARRPKPPACRHRSSTSQAIRSAISRFMSPPRGRPLPATA